MKRETCKKLLENGILQAYAEGKTIVWNGKDVKDDLELGFHDPSDWYSIKKEPEWRPFTYEELKTIMGKVIVAKDKSCAYLITEPFINSYIGVGLNNTLSVINNIVLFESYTFADGSPCGVFE